MNERRCVTQPVEISENVFSVFQVGGLSASPIAIQRVTMIALQKSESGYQPCLARLKRTALHAHLQMDVSEERYRHDSSHNEIGGQPHRSLK